jgi:hypothetical protein
VGQRGGDDGRLGGRLLIVGSEVDGILVDIGEEIFGDLREPALGVTIGSRRIAVD